MNGHESAALFRGPLTWKVLEAYVKEWAEAVIRGRDFGDLLGQLLGLLPGRPVQGEWAGQVSE